MSQDRDGRRCAWLTRWRGRCAHYGLAHAVHDGERKHSSPDSPSSQSPHRVRKVQSRTPCQRALPLASAAAASILSRSAAVSRNAELVCVPSALITGISPPVPAARTDEPRTQTDRWYRRCPVSGSTSNSTSPLFWVSAALNARARPSNDLSRVYTANKTPATRSGQRLAAQILPCMLANH